MRSMPVARKVVGVGSVGTSCWVTYMQGLDENDPLFRQFVQQWVSGLWAEKDARIDELRAQTQAS